MTNNLPEPVNKDEFMEMVEDLRPELLYPEVWTENQQKILDKQGKSNLRTKKAMFANIPMNCQGNDCPIKQDCPLYAKQVHPLGKKCPIEAQYVIDFAQGIMNELGVDPDDLLEVSQVRILVNQEVQYQRATGLLAQKGFIQENVVGVDEVGNPITRKELSTPVEYEDRIIKRMSAIRKELVATREAKVKAGQAQKDIIANITDLFDSVQQFDQKEARKLAKRHEIQDTTVTYED